MTSHTFSYKVTQLPSKHHNHSPESAINNSPKMAFFALLRAMAANPTQYESLKEGEFRDFRDEKAWTSPKNEKGVGIFQDGIVYRIQFHKIRL